MVIIIISVSNQYIVPLHNVTCQLYLDNVFKFSFHLIKKKNFGHERWSAREEHKLRRRWFCNVRKETVGKELTKVYEEGPLR